jgi:hypothetical protein
VLEVIDVLGLFGGDPLLDREPLPDRTTRTEVRSVYV